MKSSLNNGRNVIFSLVDRIIAESDQPVFQALDRWDNPFAGEDGIVIKIVHKETGQTSRVEVASYTSYSGEFRNDYEQTLEQQVKDAIAKLCPPPLPMPRPGAARRFVGFAGSIARKGVR